MKELGKQSPDLLLRINNNPEAFLHLLVSERDTGMCVDTKKGVGVTLNKARSRGARVLVIFHCSHTPPHDCYLQFFSDRITDTPAFCF